MRLRFLFGRAGSGKNDYILKDIKQMIKKHPMGPSIFFIVPDQMTFQQEYQLFSDPDIRGSMRAQVVSFSRLVWRVLQETGGGTRKFISSIGILMHIEQVITEFKRYNITPDDLYTYIEHTDQFVHKTPGEEALKNKLIDLHYIYDEVSAALQYTYIDTEDRLQLLIDKVKDTTLLKDSYIYLAGFHRFTPKELQVIEALLTHCKHMTVALTGDQPKQAISELDLFYQTMTTYKDLRDIAEANDVTIEEPIILQPTEGRFKNRPY